MAEVTWFKVLTDIFADDKIKIIQSMPEGDALLVMWFKTLSQAGKTNDGGYIYLKKHIPYTPSMLATLFGKSQQLVELALRTFSEFGMIDVDERGYIFVTNWEKHQSIDKLLKIKEQTNARVQRHREKKKLELMECNVTETLPQRAINATDIEVDLDKEKDTTTGDDFKKVADAYFEIHKHALKPIDWPDVTKVINEFGSEHVISVMKEKHLSARGTVKSFRYYLEPIKERTAARQQRRNSWQDHLNTFLEDEP